MGDFVKIEFSREQDPFGAKRRGALIAHFKVERLSAVRYLLAHVLAVAGVLVWMAAEWPWLLPRKLAAFCLAAWGVGFLGMVASGILEYKWTRQRDAYLADSEPSGEGQG